MTDTKIDVKPVARQMIGRSDIQRYAILLALIVIFAISALISGTFIQPRNLMNIGRQISVNGILAVGMTAAILTAGIDLSVGSMLAFMGVIVALLSRSTHWSVAVLATLALGVLIGLFHGSFIAKLKVPPFIVTLAGLTMYRGAALVLTDAAAIPLTQPIFYQFGSGTVPVPISLVVLSISMVYAMYKWTFTSQALVGVRIVLAILSVGLWAAAGYLIVVGQGIPYPVMTFVVILLLGSWILARTTFGRHIYAIGGNIEAARLSGVKVERVLITVYAGVALLATIGAIVLAARLNSGTPRVGVAGELDAIAAVIIGGTSFAGGSGTIGGTVIGVLLIGVLNNLLSLMNVDTNVQMIVKGIIILLAVLIDATARRD